MTVTEFSILEREDTVIPGQKLDVHTYFSRPIIHRRRQLQSNKWTKGTVTDTCGCAVKVVVAGAGEEWIESESERLAREGTKADNVRLQEGEALFAFYVPGPKKL